MGLKCLLVAVLFMSPSVFGRDCPSILKKSTNVCDECIRCGGKWCTDFSVPLHCVGDNSADNWCPANQDKLPDLNKTLPISRDGKYLTPLFVEKRAFVGHTTFQYINILLSPAVKSPRHVAYGKVVNATQAATSAVKVNTTIESKFIKVKTVIDTEFCSPNSSTFENVYVEVTLKGVSEEAVMIMYQVPCGCGCSDRVEKNSSQCSGIGDLSCGTCHCPEDRTGNRCQSEKCPDRGDSPTSSCINPSKPEVNCSGNGHCKCSECECFTDTSIEGSQYFDRYNYCEDICFATNKCADCLKSNELECDTCETAHVYIVNTTTNVLDERDESGRKVWIHCNLTTDDSCGQIEYVAMQRGGVKQLMILKGCDNTYLGVVGGTGITVPVVSSLLAVVAMMAAAAVGYMVWKGKGAAPLPLTSPEYTNIDAEDCTGVNPLYKPPTSSFKNPMYGKS